MSTQAKVTSLDALETFRASMIVFVNKARSAVDQVSDEIRRTRVWVQQEQRMVWESEIRRRTRALAQAQQELLSAKMIKLLDNLTVQQAAVRKAKLALEEAEHKLRNVKRWTRDFDSTFDPLAKRLESLRSYLAHDFPKGTAWLAQAQKTLEAYSEASSAKIAQTPPTDLPAESET